MLSSMRKVASPKGGFLDRFRNEDGVFDIASIIIGAVLAAGLTVGLTANTLSLLPWGGDMAAKSDLGAVKTAQAVHKAQVTEGLSYADLAGLKTAALLGQDANEDALAIEGDADEWAAVTKSSSGKYFSVSSADSSPKTMTGTYADPATALAAIWDDSKANTADNAVKAETP